MSGRVNDSSNRPWLIVANFAEIRMINSTAYCLGCQADGSVLRRLNAVPDRYMLSPNYSEHVNNEIDFSRLTGRDDFTLGSLKLKSLEVMNSHGIHRPVVLRVLKRASFISSTQIASKLPSIVVQYAETLPFLTGKCQPDRIKTSGMYFEGKRVTENAALVSVLSMVRARFRRKECYLSCS